MVIPSVEQAVLNRIDAIQLSQRLRRLKEAYLNETPRACGDRAKLAVEAWKQTEGEPIDLRMANLLKKFCEGVPVVIHEDELTTVGSQTRFFRGAYPFIEWDADYLPKVAEGSQVTFGSPELRGVISDEDWQACAEAMAYFKDKTPAELVKQTRDAVLGSWYDELVEARGTNRYEERPYASAVPLFETVLEKGLRGIIGEAEAGIKRFAQMQEDNPEKLYFWQAVVIACEAAINLATRYARAARELAAKEQDAIRRKELEEVANICEWVPENPARSFQEALQSVRLVSLALDLASYVPMCSWGRLDQYLYPYFRRDLDEGRLTLEMAAEPVGEFISYVGRLEQVRDVLWREHTQSTLISHITLGGVTREGEDASNELSYLILHVLGLLRYAEPHATIRWHPGTPRWLWMKAFDTNRKVAGIPMYVNDEHVIDYLVKRGVPPESAWDWAMYACSNAVAEPQRHWFMPTYVNVALVLDLALHNGVAPVTGKQIGLETGDPRTFTSFEEVYGAFKKQHEFVTRRLLWATRLAHWTEVQRWRSPLHSALLPGCVDNGKDFGVGGNGSYPICYVKDRAIIDTADSLVAMKKLVFDDKKLTMDELLKALDSNFDGDRGEEIRQMCLAAPKYGNDIDEVDYLVRDIGKFSASVIMSEKNPFGFPYCVHRPGVAWHYYGGQGVGALPNGRKAKEPLDDASLSPMRGMDKYGPTAVLRSALKADFREAELGILNQKFPLALVQSPEGLDKVASLTETFLKNGGTHIQYNFLDRQVLLEAKKHPEQYKDLVVRVAGYSAYFVLLAPEVQDDIIARTEQWL